MGEKNKTKLVNKSHQAQIPTDLHECKSPGSQEHRKCQTQGPEPGSAPNKPGESLCLPLLLNEGAGSDDFHTPFS